MNFKLFLPILTYLSLVSFLSIGQKNSFSNPLLKSGPDPWMLKHSDGFYYYMATAGDRLELRKSKTITGIREAKPVIIWKKPIKGPNSESIWAPEIHHLDGKWYIYYTATDKENNGDHNRFVFVLENASPDPFSGQWLDRGKVKTKYAGLDGSIFENNGTRYFIYSAYVARQSTLAISEMNSPWELKGKEVIIAKPTFSWEKFKEREILEGPEFLKGKNDKIYIIYSASACWDDNYSLGMLEAASTSDLLKAESWKKHPEPIFKASIKNNVYGPGHNSFTKSPDGKEDWIIYHAKAIANGECNERSTRAQEFTWRPDGSPEFKIPLPIDKPIKTPGGE